MKKTLITLGLVAASLFMVAGPASAATSEPFTSTPTPTASHGTVKVSKKALKLVESNNLFSDNAAILTPATVKPKIAQILQESGNGVMVYTAAEGKLSDITPVVHALVKSNSNKTPSVIIVITKADKDSTIIVSDKVKIKEPQLKEIEGSLENLVSQGNYTEGTTGAIDDIGFAVYDQPQDKVVDSLKTVASEDTSMDDFFIMFIVFFGVLAFCGILYALIEW